MLTSESKYAGSTEFIPLTILIRARNVLPQIKILVSALDLSRAIKSSWWMIIPGMALKNGAKPMVTIMSLLKALSITVMP